MLAQIFGEVVEEFVYLDEQECLEPLALNALQQSPPETQVYQADDESVFAEELVVSEAE